uniref:Uncharacterized protein n=1 Tax=Oryza nivara TaxID=4536 RepID=A0A0E0FPK0_ORYNI
RNHLRRICLLPAEGWPLTLRSPPSSAATILRRTCRQRPPQHPPPPKETPPWRRRRLAATCRGAVLLTTSATTRNQVGEARRLEWGKGSGVAQDPSTVASPLRLRGLA